MAGSSGFLTGVVSIVDHEGKRVDTPNVDGDHAPVELQLGPSMAATKTTNGSLTRVTINATGGSGGVVLALDTHDDFRGFDVEDVPDGSVIHFKNPVGVFVYETTLGAGENDDDESILKLDDISLGSNGRAYSVDAPVVPTIAALNLAVSGKNKTVEVQAYANAGDNGGGIFDLREGTATDDGGTIIVPNGVTSFYYARRYTGALHGEWFGVRGDSQCFYDGALSVGTNFLDSATAAFTTAVTGKRALVRMPSNPCTNPVTLTSGNNVFSGTALDVDFATLPGSGVPRTGGGIVAIINDAGVLTYRAVLIVTATVGVLYTANPVVGAATAKTMYRETQAEVYLEYVSATRVKMWANPNLTGAVNSLFTETSVPVIFGVDSSDAIERLRDKMIALSATTSLPPVAVLPPGKIAISRNIKGTGGKNITIAGHGRDVTVLCDLRKPSFELTSAHVEANSDHGALSWANADNIQFCDMSYDASLHLVGMAHSTGGVTNASGGRLAFFMRNVTNPAFRRLGSMGGLKGYGARDEHVYHDTGCTNCVIEDCVLGDATHPTNGPSLNPVSGDGVRITRNVCVSHFAALECSCDSPTVTDNQFSNYNAYPIGAPVCIMAPRGRTVFCQNTIRDSVTTSGGVEAVIFGQGSYSNAVLICSDNIFSNLLGLYGAGSDGSNLAGVISLEGFNGTAYITDNVFDNVRSTTSYDKGRFIVVRAPTVPCAGRIYIGHNVAQPNPASGEDNMAVGVHVYGNVAPGVVVDLGGNDWAECPYPFIYDTSVRTKTGELGEMLRGSDLRDEDKEIKIWDFSQTFTVNVSTNVCTSGGTIGVDNDDEVIVETTFTIPGGLSRGKRYWVRDKSGATFKLAKTKGGTAIDITTTGTGTHTYKKIVGNRFVLPEKILSANRSASLAQADETGVAEDGDIVRIERRDTNNFTYAVTNNGAETLYTFPAGKKGAADFRNNGSSWAFSGKSRIQ